MSAVPAFLLRVAQTAAPAAAVNGAARAALPPRFAPLRDGPQGAEFAAPKSAEAPSHAVMSRTQQALAARLSTEAPASARVALQDGHPTEAEPSATVPVPVLTPTQRMSVQAAAAVPANLAIEPAVAQAAFADPPIPSNAQPTSATRPASAARPESVAAMAQQTITPARVTPPLRASTVAQHAASTRAGAAPTVVHVTIDRIDVRAPAAPAPGRAAAKARAPVATSLADYLRQRGGAASSS